MHRGQTGRFQSAVGSGNGPVRPQRPVAVSAALSAPGTAPLCTLFPLLPLRPLPCTHVHSGGGRKLCGNWLKCGCWVFQSVRQPHSPCLPAAMCADAGDFEAHRPDDVKERVLKVREPAVRTVITCTTPSREQAESDVHTSPLSQTLFPDCSGGVCEGVGGVSGTPHRHSSPSQCRLTAADGFHTAAFTRE